MRGVVFDLDETLLDCRGSLDAYARRLRSAFDSRASSALDVFVAEFHRLDADGKTPRTQFFELLASRLLPIMSAGEIQHHFETYAWQCPQLFPGVANMLLEPEAQGLELGVITNGGEAKEEGVLRKHMMMRDGRVRDSVLYSVIRSEWPQVRTALEEKIAAHNA